MSDQAPRKRPSDLNRLAASIVASATGDGDEYHVGPDTGTHERIKNPAAVALGKLGGLKGGKSRAEKLTSEQRTEIAKKAASARWERRNHQ